MLKCDLCDKEFDEQADALSTCENCGLQGCNDEGAEDGDGCFGDTSGTWDCPECGHMNGEEG